MEWVARQRLEPQKGAGGLEFSEAPAPPGLEATMLILTSNAEDAGPELGKLVEPLAPFLGRQPFTQLAGGRPCQSRVPPSSFLHDVRDGCGANR
jgi:hypothetical protein